MARGLWVGEPTALGRGDDDVRLLDSVVGGVMQAGGGAGVGVVVEADTGVTLGSTVASSVDGGSSRGDCSPIGEPPAVIRGARCAEDGGVAAI